MRPDTEHDIQADWMYHMRRGDFQEAWKLSDQVLRSHAGVPCWHLPRHLQYVWDGTPLSGKRVLVRCYHGLGDTIQFARYLPQLSEIASDVVVWSQPALIPLLSTVRCDMQLLPLHDGAPGVEFNVDVEIMELPHIFRTTLAGIPAQVPYLHVEPALLTAHKGCLAVGIVHRAGNWDERRSIPLGLFAPLSRLPGVTLYFLQQEVPATDEIKVPGIVLGGYNVLEYARVIRALDLLISVDTMAVHLAGALGVPVWNLLHADADWRWMEDREDSPWYPTMRLFRQERHGDWQQVIERITSGVFSWVRGGR